MKEEEFKIPDEYLWITDTEGYKEWPDKDKEQLLEYAISILKKNKKTIEK